MVCFWLVGCFLGFIIVLDTGRTDRKIVLGERRAAVA